jgi:hypothetical protein
LKNLFISLFVICFVSSCSDSSSGDDSQIYDAPNVRSYVSYTSQNSVTLNGFIDFSNIVFQEEDSYNVGFIFRTGDENDASNDQVIELEGEVPYYNGIYNFHYDIDLLEPNTTYYYTATTKNGSSEEFDWESFTTSDISCTHTQNNYVSISGTWQSAYTQITDPLCCDEGNVGVRFGNWPNIYEINFNEQNNGYPKTGQYFGVDYEFDITYLNRELVKSTNQVLIGSRSTPETELFVENDGETLTLIFCNTVLRNGDTLNGKVSVSIQ